ncbi:MAG: M14 family metallopeptidase [Oscillospiraceae bacterium]
MKKKSIIILVVIVIAALAAYQLLRNDQHLSDNYISKNNNPSKPINSHIQEKANTDGMKSEYSRNNMFTYGQSGMNAPLMAYKVNNQCPSRKILCVFAIHGFEDAFFKDGQALVDTANGVIEYFQNNPESLNEYELIIVTCANPDGLAQGWTCNGPGRCQISQGIDLNMDFDFNFRPRVNVRNLTGEKPFASPEAAALRDLVFSEKPDIIIDFHGWINCAAGDPQIAEIFCKHLGLTYEKTDQAIYDGFFSGWAAKYARAVLVEYPNPFTGQGSFDGTSDSEYDYTVQRFSDFRYTEKTIQALEEIVARKM